MDPRTDASRPLAARGLIRPTLFLVCGAAIALPLGACQPRPAAPDPAGPPVAAAPARQPPAQAAEPPVREVVRERIVYVDRPVPATPQDPVLARVAGREIRYSQVREPLLQGHGLSILLYVVQLELARAEAQRRNLTVGPADIEAEVAATLRQMFPDAEPEDHAPLLDQLLQQQRLTRTDFELVMATNAHLRAIAATMIPDQAREETLREAFNVRYGETVRVRHIASSNLQEVAEARRRLQAGASFETVARELSRNPRTAPLGGELPPFSRAAQDVAPAFKDAAFALNEGEISDPVLAEGMYHLIKLERRIPPRAIRFEDVRDSLQAELTRLALDAAVREFRQTLADQARATLEIQDPILAEQWAQRLREAERLAPPSPPVP